MKVNTIWSWLLSRIGSRWLCAISVCNLSSYKAAAPPSSPLDSLSLFPFPLFSFFLSQNLSSPPAFSKVLISFLTHTHRHAHTRTHAHTCTHAQTKLSRDEKFQTENAQALLVDSKHHACMPCDSVQRRVCMSSDKCLNWSNSSRETDIELGDTSQAQSVFSPTTWDWETNRTTQGKNAFVELAIRQELKCNF